MAIITKNSNTGGAIPTAGQLQVGELAVNTADGLIYTKHTDNVVKRLSANPPSSANLTGVPTASTAAVGTNTTQLATTAFVLANVTDSLTSTSTTLALSAARGKSLYDTKAPNASPALTGTPTAPTAAVGTNTEQIATTAFVLANTNNNLTSTSISQLAAASTTGAVNVLNYHSGVEGGGGVFYWDSTKLKSEHNGGTVIDPSKVFPSDWNDQTQVTTWFIAGTTGSGCWVRQVSDTMAQLEWFGAKTGDSAFDNAIIFNHVQHHVKEVKLLPKDYWIKTTVNIVKDGFSVIGSGVHWTPTNKATRVILNNAVLDAFFISNPTATPTNPNTFLQEACLQNFDILRVARNPPPSGSEITAGAGVRLRYTLYTKIELVISEFNIGVVLEGTVRTYLKNCYSFISNAITPGGANASNDFFFGFFLNGNSNIGLAGGNASSYIRGCTSSVGGNPALLQSIGFLSIGACADTFLDEFESAMVSEPIRFEGSTTDDNSKYVDVRINKFICDVFDVTAIRLINFPNGGSFVINNGYAAPKSGSGGSMLGCVSVQNSQASVFVFDNQFICHPNSTAIGVYVSNSKNVHSRNIIKNSARPVVVENSTHCIFEDSVSNLTVNANHALLAHNLKNSVIDISVNGTNDIFGEAIALSEVPSSVRNEIRLSKVDVDSVQSTFKLLVWDGAAYTRPSTNGQVINNNLITGIVL